MSESQGSGEAHEVSSLQDVCNQAIVWYPSRVLGFPGGSDSSLSAVQETSVSSLGREDPLEKGMATHSSILSWTIPWAVEPGGLQSMMSQRVRQTEQLTHTAGLRWAGSKKCFTFTHAIPRIATWWCQMAYVCLFSTGKTYRNFFYFFYIYKVTREFSPLCCL